MGYWRDPDACRSKVKELWRNDKLMKNNSHSGYSKTSMPFFSILGQSLSVDSLMSGVAEEVCCHAEDHGKETNTEDLVLSLVPIDLEKSSSLKWDLLHQMGGLLQVMGVQTAYYS